MATRVYDKITPETSMGFLDAEIANIYAELTSSEGDISTLQTDLNTAETDIANLEAGVVERYYGPDLWRGSATTDGNYVSYQTVYTAMPDAATSRITFTVPIPAAFAGLALGADIYWTSDVITGEARMFIQGAIVANGNNLNAAPTYQINNGPALMTAPGTAHLLQEWAVASAGTVPASPTLLTFRLTRTGTHGDDDMAGDFRVLGVRIYGE